MKISTNTDAQLIIENNPVLLAFLLNAFHLIFLGVGIFMIRSEFWIGLALILSALLFGLVFNLAFVRRTQFIFDRTEDLVEMRRKSLLGYRRRTWALGDLSHAKVESSSSDGSTTYRAALVFATGMDAGTVPMTVVYSSGSGAERAASAVNNWLSQVIDSRAPKP